MDQKSFDDDEASDDEIKSVAITFITFIAFLAVVAGVLFTAVLWLA